MVGLDEKVNKQKIGLKDTVEVLASAGLAYDVARRHGMTKKEMLTELGAAVVGVGALQLIRKYGLMNYTRAKFNDVKQKVNNYMNK